MFLTTNLRLGTGQKCTCIFAPSPNARVVQKHRLEQKSTKGKQRKNEKKGEKQSKPCNNFDFKMHKMSKKSKKCMSNEYII